MMYILHIYLGVENKKSNIVKHCSCQPLTFTDYRYLMISAFTEIPG